MNSRRLLRRNAPVLVALVLTLCAVSASAQSVTGTVRDAQSGATLPSMVVAAYTTAGNLQAVVTTDASGRYTLPLPMGKYHVLAYDPTGVYATEFANDAPSFEESPVTDITGIQTVTINFALKKGGIVSGVVLTAGGVHPNMTVAAYNLSGTRRAFTLTDGSGAYSLVLPPGQYKIVAYDDANNFAPAFFHDQTSFEAANIVTVTAGRTVTGVDLFLQLGARVGGAVTDVNGTPVAGASVLVYTPAGKYVNKALTGPDGRFDLTLAGGSYRFVVIDNSFKYAAGFLGDSSAFETSTILTLASGQVKNNLAFHLEKGGLVEGTVIDAAGGAGLAGITVAAYNIDGTMRTFVTTDANGRYVLLLPTGNFRIAAFDPALVYATQFYPQQTVFSASVAISATVGPTTTLQPFVLARGGRVAGRVVDAVSAAELVGMVVAAYDANGNAVASTTTTTGGNYRLVVPAGSYRLIAYDPRLQYAPAYRGNATSFDAIELLAIAANTDMTADFRMRRGTLVAGTVVDPTRRPIAGIEVTALDLQGNRIASATTEADGSFQLSLVPGTYKFIGTDPAGRYSLSYYGGDTFPDATAVTVDATGAPRITVTLQPPARRRAVRR